MSVPRLVGLGVVGALLVVGAVAAPQWWAQRGAARQAQAAADAAVRTCHAAVRAGVPYASRARFTQTRTLPRGAGANATVDVLGLVDLLQHNGATLPYHYHCTLDAAGALVRKPTVAAEGSLYAR